MDKSSLDEIGSIGRINEFIRNTNFNCDLFVNNQPGTYKFYGQESLSELF